jgi:hypothetical protein
MKDSLISLFSSLKSKLWIENLNIKKENLINIIFQKFIEINMIFFYQPSLKLNSSEAVLINLDNVLMT